MIAKIRSISISTDVFAKIWQLRQADELDEDSILRRVLFGGAEAESEPKRHNQQQASSGFFDSRHSVEFREGFEIFRVYKGLQYRAVATGGTWKTLHDGKFHLSLNALSRSIGATTENAWKGWLYRDAGSISRVISDLRNNVNNREQNRTPSQAIPLTDEEGDVKFAPRTWLDDVRSALADLGGKAHLHEIYKATVQRRKREARSVPRTAEAVIRRTLENFSSDSKAYLGGEDLFFMPNGKGAGFWAVRA